MLCSKISGFLNKYSTQRAARSSRPLAARYGVQGVANVACGEVEYLSRALLCYVEGVADVAYNELEHMSGTAKFSCIISNFHVG